MAISDSLNGQDHEKQAHFCPFAGTFLVKWSISDSKTRVFPVEHSQLIPKTAVKPVSRSIRETFYAV
jgi:hypothetical protein